MDGHAMNDTRSFSSTCIFSREFARSNKWSSFEARTVNTIEAGNRVSLELRNRRPALGQARRWMYLVSQKACRREIARARERLAEALKQQIADGAQRPYEGAGLTVLYD